MTEQDFRDSLPAQTECEVCSRPLGEVLWEVRSRPGAQWMAIGIAKCPRCSIVRMASAGSDEVAHAYAQKMRLDFMKSAGLMH